MNDPAAILSDDLPPRNPWTELRKEISAYTTTFPAEWATPEDFARTDRVLQRVSHLVDQIAELRIREWEYMP